MQLEKIMKKTKKALHDERDRLSNRVVQINHIIDALSVNGERPKLGKKHLSAAHRAAIKRGIAKAKKANGN
jgi:hypothetical protein